MKKQNLKSYAGLVAAAAIWMGTTTSANASVSFSAAGSGGRAASVEFDIVGNDLQVTLTSSGTQPSPTWDATYSLTAVFFNYSGAGTLSGSGTASGTLVSGSTMPSGHTLGDYWAFDQNLTAPNGASMGLRGAGYSTVGGSGFGNLGSSNVNLDGSDGGILGWNTLNGSNSSIKDPQVYQSIVFHLALSDVPASLSASDFSDISFQYGTALNEPRLDYGAPVPEPSTVIAGLLLVVPLGLSTVRIVRRNRVK
ncbi:hypothetical protein GC207_02305 [bacterium]|nr:hypothetical protein [bacterium]